MGDRRSIGIRGDRKERQEAILGIAVRTKTHVYPVSVKGSTLKIS